jgi:hypothetical protein
MTLTRTELVLIRRAQQGHLICSGLRRFKFCLLRCARIKIKSELEKDRPLRFFETIELRWLALTTDKVAKLRLEYFKKCFLPSPLGSCVQRVPLYHLLCSTVMTFCLECRRQQELVEHLASLRLTLPLQTPHRPLSSCPFLHVPLLSACPSCASPWDSGRHKRVGLPRRE